MFAQLLLFTLLLVVPFICIVAGIVLGRHVGKTTKGKVFFSILWSAGLLVGLAAVYYGACMCILSQLNF